VTSPSEVFRARLREVRRLKGWTQQQLADELASLGVRLDASGITRMERGTRGVTLDDVIAIAAALGVSPLHMIVPLDDNGAQLTPSLTVPTADARAWLRGQLPLDQADEHLFYAQTPESEADWFPLVPGEWRFQNQEDFKATRARWEREIFRAAIGGRISQEPGPDAEDIPVRRPGQAQQPPIVAAIVTSDRGVLVGRRNDGKPPWTFIAGEQDSVQDESPEDTAVREVKEETGLRIRAGEVIGERVHPKTGRTMIYLAAEPVRGTDVFVGDEDELAEVRWVTLAEADELLPGMFEPVREHLERELGGADQ
jgi:8-oxo-dGTP pyrophosphatase MutT (NUDIX family)/transcriptional regulator with XRE-family HTH domain